MPMLDTSQGNRLWKCWPWEALRVPSGFAKGFADSFFCHSLNHSESEVAFASLCNTLCATQQMPLRAFGQFKSVKNPSFNKKSFPYGKRTLFWV